MSVQKTYTMQRILDLLHGIRAHAVVLSARAGTPIYAQAYMPRHPHKYRYQPSTSIIIYIHAQHFHDAECLGNASANPTEHAAKSAFTSPTLLVRLLAAALTLRFVLSASTSPYMLFAHTI